MVKDYKNKETAKSTALHPNQLTALDALNAKARELECDFLDVRGILIGREASKIINQFKLTETYTTAKNKGLHWCLMHCVDAQARVIAQSIINERYSSFNDDGSERDRRWSSSNDIAPHLSYINEASKIKAFSRELYQKQEIILTDEIKKAIVKHWGYLAGNKNSTEEINLKSFE